MTMDAETRAVMVELVETSTARMAERMFTELGIDRRHPLESQKDFVALREMRKLLEDPDFQQDLAKLRRWRKTMDSVESKGFVAALSLVCVGGIALILMAFRVKLFGHS